MEEDCIIDFTPDFEDPFLDFLLADSTSNVSSIEDKKRPREASEASDDGKSDGRRSTTPEPAKKRKKIDPVSCTHFVKDNNLPSHEFFVK